MLGRDIKAHIEQVFPAILAVASVVSLLVFKSQTIEFFKQHALSLGQLYAGIFGWAGVQTSGLLGFYGIIFSKNDGFIGRLKGSFILDEFFKFVKRSLWLALTLTIVSIPVLVKNEELKELDTVWYCLVVFWFSLFVWSIASFVRVLLIFGAMINVVDRKETIPG